MVDAVRTPVVAFYLCHVRAVLSGFHNVIMSLVSVVALLLGAQGRGASNAEMLFRKSEAKLKSAKSLACTEVGSGEATYRIDLLFQKPRSFRSTGSGIDLYCNGKMQVNHILDEKSYFRTDVTKAGFDPPDECLSGFFGIPTGQSAPYFIKSTKFAMVKLAGKMCAAKTTTFESYGRGDNMVYYVDPRTQLPLGWDQEFGGTKMQFRIRDLRLNVPVPPGLFEWKPGPGDTEKRH